MLLVLADATSLSLHSTVEKTALLTFAVAVPVGACRYLSVPVGACRCLSVPVGTLSLHSTVEKSALLTFVVAVPVGACRYLSVPVGAYRYRQYLSVAGPTNGQAGISPPYPLPL